MTAALTEHYQASGTVTAGELAVHSNRAMRLALMGFPDGDVIITLECATKQAVRTLKANNYLWVILTLMADEIGGVSKDDVHDMMCAEYLVETVELLDKRTGEVTFKKVVRGTSRLGPKRFGEFVDRVKLHAQEFLGMDVPEPEAA